MEIIRCKFCKKTFRDNDPLYVRANKCPCCGESLPKPRRKAAQSGTAATGKPGARAAKAEPEPMGPEARPAQPPPSLAHRRLWLGAVALIAFTLGVVLTLGVVRWRERRPADRVPGTPTPSAPAAPVRSKPAAPEEVEGDADKYVLRVEVTMEEGKIRKTEAVALRDASPPPLSDAESAAFRKALEHLLETCGKSPKAAQLLMEVVPERALRRFVQIYPKADEDARRAMLIATKGSKAPEALHLLALGIADSKKSARRWSQGVWHTAKALLAKSDRAIPVSVLKPVLSAAEDEAVVRSLEALPKAHLRPLADLLQEMLSHKSPGVRAQVLARLPDLEAPWVVEAIRRELGHASTDVRKAAVRALAARKQVRDGDLVKCLKGAEEAMTDTVLEQMASARDATLAKLFDRARKSNSEDRLAIAVRTALRLGKSSHTAWLLQLLKDKRKKVRAAAAEVLGKHSATADFAPLVRTAKDDKEADVRDAAARGLAARGEGVRAATAGLSPNDKPWMAFLGGLRDRDKGGADAFDAAMVRTLKLVRERKASVDLGKLVGLRDACGPARKLGLCELVVELGDGRAQKKAIDALAAETSASAKDALIKVCRFASVLPEKTVDSKTELTEAGGSFFLTMTPQEEHIWELIWRTLASETPARKSAAKKALLATAKAAVSNADEATRAGALRVLGQFGPAENMDAILKSASDKSATVREAAARAMKGQHGEAVVAKLRVLAGDGDTNVQRAAAEAISEIPKRDLYPAVKKLLASSGTYVRAATCAALRHHPEHVSEFVSAVRDMTSHKAEQVAVDGLALAPGDAARRALSRIAAQAKLDELAVKAIVALHQLAQNGKLSTAQLAESLRPLLKSPHERRQFLAAWVLASSGVDDARPVLLGLVGKKAGAESVTFISPYVSPVGRLVPSPNHAKLGGLCRSESGTHSDGFVRRTFYVQLPMTIGRAEASFGAGDRWPFDEQYSVNARDIALVLVAVARYRTPDVDAAIEAARKHESEELRRGAVWAMAMRDDGAGVEGMLGDKIQTVVDDAARALRMLGHRASVPALLAQLKRSKTAARAVVEICRRKEGGAD